jgi:hypothetical protein
MDRRRKKMKKTIGLSLMALTLLFGSVVNTASAKTVSTPTIGASHAVTAAAVAPQRWNRQRRTRFVTRTERQGWRVYRVTYRITTLWNGRTISQMVSRVRIR